MKEKKKEDKMYLIYYYIPGQETLEIYSGIDSLTQMANDCSFLCAWGVPLCANGWDIDYNPRAVWLNKANIVEIIELKK